MRVIVDGKCLQPPRGGVARYLEGVLAGLAEVAHPDVTVETVTPRSPGRTLPWVLGGLRRASRAGADLLHCPFYYPPPWPGCPVVVVLHDVLFLEHPEWFSPRLLHPMRLLAGFGSRRAAAVVTFAEATAREIVARCRVPRARIHVIPHGVDHVRFAPAPPRAIAVLRDRLGLSAPYLLQVGAIEPRRGIDLALAAAVALRERHGALQLALAGETRGAVPALAAPAPWVRLLGRVDDADLAALYTGAAAVLAPSRGEGFDLPVLEALACGAVVVASDIPAHVEHFSGAAEFFADGDAASLAAACGELLADGERAAARRAAGPGLASRFSWREAARRHLELWREVAAR